MSAETQDRPLTYEEEHGKPMPSKNHGYIQANLIGEFIRNRNYRIGSEVTLLVNSVRLTPDLSIFPRDLMDLRQDISKVAEPPLLVVEIFSPQQGTEEVFNKVDQYFRHGIKSVWIVSPPLHTVQILTADGGETTLNAGIATDPVTGLTADLAAVFS